MSAGDLDAAERDYREALQIARSVSDPELVVTCLGNLGALASLQNRWSQAELLAREALALAEKLGRLALIADNSRILAMALAKRGHAADGLTHARRAVEILTRLRSPYLSSAEATLRDCGG